MTDRHNGEGRAKDTVNQVSDTANSERTDHAAALSRSVWSSDSRGSVPNDTKAGNAATSATASDGFQIVDGNDTDPTKVQEKAESGDRSKIMDKGEKSDDPSHPSNWKTDKFGNVTEAGPDYKAEYNDKGELQSVTQGDDTWTRLPDGTIQHDDTDAQGNKRSEIIDNVRSFSAEPYFSDLGGGLLGGMNVEIGTGKTGASGYSKPIYQDSAHDKAATGIVDNMIKSLQGAQGGEEKKGSSAHEGYLGF
ncbi:MAG: hypothetical protein KC652_20030 [Cyanobacteria bacterium HKST-UBA01]|nr:hypothetical protein [Cyanobacteria bacterium HKST-UBA01]